MMLNMLLMTVASVLLSFSHVDVLRRRRMRHWILTVVLHVRSLWWRSLLRVGHLRRNILWLAGGRSELEIIVEGSQVTNLLVARAHDGLSRWTLRLRSGDHVNWRRNSMHHSRSCRLR